jgi:hypothetical protein
MKTKTAAALFKKWEKKGKGESWQMTASWKSGEEAQREADDRSRLWSVDLLAGVRTPTKLQSTRILLIHALAKRFESTLKKITKPSMDQLGAIRRLRETVMYATEAILIEKDKESCRPPARTA